MNKVYFHSFKINVLLNQNIKNPINSHLTSNSINKPQTPHLYSYFTHSSQVQATDKGSPPRSATIRVRIDVLPRPSLSSLPPVCKDVDSHAAVAESDPVSQTVTFLQVEDPDGDNLWYSIVGKESGGFIELQNV